MIDQKNRIRCNMYLDKNNVQTVKDFIQGTGLSFSSYVDLLVCGVADRLRYYAMRPTQKRLLKSEKLHKSNQVNKIRCNTYLDKKSVEFVKAALKDVKITFSGYIDHLVCAAAKRITLSSYKKHVSDFPPKDGEPLYFNIWEAHKILGLTGIDPETLDLSDVQQKSDENGTIQHTMRFIDYIQIPSQLKKD